MIVVLLIIIIALAAISINTDENEYLDLLYFTPMKQEDTELSAVSYTAEEEETTQEASVTVAQHFADSKYSEESKSSVDVSDEFNLDLAIEDEDLTPSAFAKSVYEALV